MTRLLLIAVFLLPGPLLLRADDVTLKSGKTYKGLTLIKESKSRLTFETAEGKKLTFRRTAIEKWEKKPTPLGEFLEREEKLDRKDVKGMYELATWAKEKGLERRWPSLMKAVLRLDRNHAGAHEALGDHLVDGRWVDARKWKRLEAKRLEESYKARGWKKLRGEWVSPADYSRMKKGLVRHGEHWVTPKMLAAIKEKGLVFAEGTWMTQDDAEKAAQGMVRTGKRWVPADQLDEQHQDMRSPWVLADRDFELLTNCDHRTGRMLREEAKDAYEGCRAVFGADVDIHGPQGRLVVFVGRSLDDYKTMGTAFPGSDRASLQSSAGGVFYGARFADRGAGMTYYHTAEYARWWTGQAMVLSYIYRILPEEKTDEDLVRALTAYVASFHEGAYAPRWWTYATDKMLNDEFLGRKDPELLLKSATYERKPMVRAGFAMHFFAQRDPEAFKKYVREHFCAGRATLPAFLKAMNPKGGNLNEEFAAFVQEYQKAFRPWDKK